MREGELHGPTMWLITHRDCGEHELSRHFVTVARFVSASSQLARRLWSLQDIQIRSSRQSLLHARIERHSCLSSDSSDTKLICESNRLAGIIATVERLTPHLVVNHSSHVQTTLSLSHAGVHYSLHENCVEAGTLQSLLQSLRNTRSKIPLARRKGSLIGVAQTRECFLQQARCICS